MARNAITSASAAAGVLACVLAPAGWAAEPSGGPGQSDPRTTPNGYFAAAIAPTPAWSSAGNGPADDHFAPAEHVLSRYSLGSLTTRWVFTARGEVSDTPTVEGNAVYFSDRGGLVWRLDARTGKAVWGAALPAITGLPNSRSRVSPAIGLTTVIVGDQAAGTVIALSKSGGKPVWRTTVASDVGAILTSSPVVVGNRVYVGVSSGQEGMAVSTPNFVPTFRGSVAALDLTDGHIVWQTHTVPPGFTGGAVWSSNLAVDAARHAVYLSTGNNYSVPVAVAACQAAATTPTQLDACLPAEDYMDSVMSLNSDTGRINWGRRFQGADTWTVSCLKLGFTPATPCPSPAGLDYDFGAAPNLFSISRGGVTRDVVGAGQKSGAYWTLDRNTGQTVWATQVGPGGALGGIEWGTATDGVRVYVPASNSASVDTALIPSGQHTNGGFWSALDAATGKILWQTPTLAADPQAPATRAKTEGSVSVANGVLYGEDTAGTFVGLDAATGMALKSLQSGGAAIAGPAVVNGVLYWGSGYAAYGATNNKLYALWIGHN